VRAFSAYYVAAVFGRCHLEPIKFTTDEGRILKDRRFPDAHRKLSAECVFNSFVELAPFEMESINI
jgi:hypothetical protein